MSATLREITENFLARTPELTDCENVETKVAIALLLSHLIPADGKILDCEMDRLSKLASRRFHVDQSIVKKFMALTQLNRKHPIPIESLTEQLKSDLADKQLQLFIKDLWDIALSDDDLHSLEEAMIYNVADHLGVCRRDVAAQQAKVCR
jgi:uncharacterized tellurite resistance protein B-like protein